MRKRRVSAPPDSRDTDDDMPMTEATKRINEIIEDADRQAGQIIVNAEVEARRYLSSVKEKADQDAAEYAQAMAALSEALISQAEALNRESQRLLATLDTAVEAPRQTQESELAPGRPAQEEVAHPPALSDHRPAGQLTERRQSEPGSRATEFADPATARPAGDLPDIPEPGEEFSAGARLLATQMAVAGSTRGDIEDRLINDFGIGDPGPLLDSILGPG